MFKLVKTCLNLLKSVQTCSNLLKIVQTCSNLFKFVQTCSNLFKLVQTCLFLFKLDQTCSNLFLPVIIPFSFFNVWATEAWSKLIKLVQIGSNLIKLVQTCFYLLSSPSPSSTSELPNAMALMHWFSNLSRSGLDLFNSLLIFCWNFFISKTWKKERKSSKESREIRSAIMSYKWIFVKR